jgi:hypothetical protein
MERIMSNTTKAMFAALVVLVGTSSAFAAPHRMDRHRMHHSASIRDPWFKPLHLDNADVPAKTYFEEMQQDGH